MSIIIQGLAGEKMNGADLAEHPPARAVRSKDEVLIVVSDIFGTGVRRTAGEVGIVDLQELRRRGSGCRHDDVHEAEPEVHERAVGSSQRGERVVRHVTEVREVSDNRPWFRTGR